MYKRRQDPLKKFLEALSELRENEYEIVGDNHIHITKPGEGTMKFLFDAEQGKWVMARL
jgi:hypothetical protein